MGRKRRGRDGTLWHEDGTECRMAQSKRLTCGLGFEAGTPPAAFWHKVCLSNAKNNKTQPLNTEADRRNPIPRGSAVEPKDKSTCPPMNMSASIADTSLRNSSR